MWNFLRQNDRLPSASAGRVAMGLQAGAPTRSISISWEHVKMQSLRPRPRPTDSETWDVRPCSLPFNKPPRGLHTWVWQPCHAALTKSRHRSDITKGIEISSGLGPHWLSCCLSPDGWFWFVVCCLALITVALVAFLGGYFLIRQGQLNFCPFQQGRSTVMHHVCRAGWQSNGCRDNSVRGEKSSQTSCLAS